MESNYCSTLDNQGNPLIDTAEIIHPESKKSSSTVFNVVVFVCFFINIYYVYRYCNLHKNFNDFKVEMDDLMDVDHGRLAELYEKQIANELDKRFQNMKLDEILTKKSRWILSELQNDVYMKHNKRIVREAFDCNCPKGDRGDKGFSEQSILQPLDIVNGLRLAGVRIPDFSINDLKGDMGPPGDISPGVEGIPGIDGKHVFGERGDMGLQGPPGEKGITGPPGAPGVKGEPGNDGLPGRNGLQGSKGVTGDIGTTGAKGTKGIRY